MSGSAHPALAGMLAQAISELSAASVPDEALAVLRPARRIGPLTRPARFVPAGRAWRLGALLLSRDAELFATGSVVRAIIPKDFAANKSPAEEARRELQRAAARGPFTRGESVNHGYEPAIGTVVLVDGDEPMLALPDARVPLRAYLDERVRLFAERGGTGDH
jgi:hypothetical protein